MAITARLDVSRSPASRASAVVQDLTYTADAYGTSGNSITITYTDPGGNNQPIAVSVIGNAISVSLATNGGGTITSTATQVKAAVDGSAPAAALVDVAISGTAGTVQTAQSSTPLASGAASTASVPANQTVPLTLTLTNSVGTPVPILAMKLLCSFPADSDNPVPSFAKSNLDAPAVTVPASASTYVPCSVAIFGKETGVYTVDCEVSYAGNTIRCSNIVSLTLV